MNIVKNVPLGDLMSKQRLSIEPSKYPDEVFDLYSVPSFDAGTPEIVMGSQVGSSKLLVQPGDVLLCKIVPHIRRAWVVGQNRGRRQLASTEWIIFRSSAFDPAFLRHLLTSDMFHKQLMRTVAGVGGSLLRARPTDVANITVTLPPLCEQRRIAEVLDRTETLIALRRKSVDLLTALVEAVFYETFGDPSVNPHAWPVAELGEFIEFGPQNGLYKPSSLYGSGTRILRIDSFYDGMITDQAALKRVAVSDAERNVYGLQPGDVVINRVNSLDYLGKCALVPDLAEPTIFESNMMRIRVDPNRLHPRFLVQLLQSNYVKSQILQKAKKAVNQASINQQDVRSLKVIVPPVSLQRQFVHRVESIESHKAAQRAALGQLEALYASLQYRAFRGEL